MDKWGFPDCKIVPAGTILHRGKEVKLLACIWECDGKPEWDDKGRFCRLQKTCDFSCPYGIPNRKCPEGFMNELAVRPK